MLVKKIISSTLVALAVILSSLSIASTVNAQTTTTPPTQTTNQSKRCTIAQGRLNTRITALDTVKTKQSQVYNDILTKFETRIDTAQKNGYDVTEMTKARDEAKAKIEVYNQKATALGTSIMATKNLSCGDSDTSFTTSLTSTRTALAEAKTASAAVRTAYSEKVITSLKDYATWLDAQVAEENK